MVFDTFPHIPVYGLDSGIPEHAAAAVPVRDRESETALTALAQRMGSRLLVPEIWRHILPQCGMLISSAISGGSLSERFLTAAAAYPRRCWLLLEPLSMEFPLPCPDGIGTPISGPPEGHAFYSEDLCCYYTHYIRNSQGFLVLFDTEDSLSKKRVLAQASGFLGWAGPVEICPSGAQQRQLLPDGSVL